MIMVSSLSALNLLETSSLASSRSPLSPPSCTSPVISASSWLTKLINPSEPVIKGERPRGGREGEILFRLDSNSKSAVFLKPKCVC